MTTTYYYQTQPTPLPTLTPAEQHLIHLLATDSTNYFGDENNQGTISLHKNDEDYRPIGLAISDQIPWTEPTPLMDVLDSLQDKNLLTHSTEDDPANWNNVREEIWFDYELFKHLTRIMRDNDDTTNPLDKYPTEAVEAADRVFGDTITRIRAGRTANAIPDKVKYWLDGYTAAHNAIPQPRREYDTFTSAEFKALRESMGLTTRWLANHWGSEKNETTIKRWESTRTPPMRACAALLQLKAEFDQRVHDAIMNPASPLIVPRTDAESMQYPAAYWRAAAERVFELANIHIEFPTEQDPVVMVDKYGELRDRMRHLSDEINDMDTTWHHDKTDAANIQAVVEDARDQLEQLLESVNDWPDGEKPDEETIDLWRNSIIVAENLIEEIEAQ